MGILLSLKGGEIKPILKGSCSGGDNGTRFDIASSTVARGPGVGEEGVVGGFRL